MNPNILNLTLLYVEDDDDTRESLSEVFANKVKTLYIAKDGAEGLALFKEHSIHFIISDYKMPHMNGNELCKAVKEINPIVCFILLTAYNETDLLVSAIESGVDRFLQKPVNAKKLFSLLDEVNEKITKRIELEKSTICLKEAEQIANLSYWDLNLQTKKLSFSAEAIELFNLSSSVIKDIGYKEFARVVKEEDRANFLEIFERRIYIESSVDEVISINSANNNTIYIHIIAKKWDSSACGVQHVIGLFQDVSHYEIQKVRLLKESQSDPMLQISNKKFIVLELENLLKSAKRYGHALGVIFLDIDNFKAINDCYGHLIADDILVQLSKLISHNIRQSDHFGRWGGDEFVILTGYSTSKTTIELAQKILKKIEEYLWMKGVKLTVSIGLSFYELGDNVNTLLQRADLKMLEAKKSGKNRYSY